MLQPSLMEVATVCLRLGATAYGGWGMLAFIKREMVERRAWVSVEVFQEGIALAQALPGPAVVNTVAFVGYRLHGVSGAAIAASVFVFPSMAIMMLLSAAYFRYGDIIWVQRLFHGLGALVVAILGHACVSLARITVRGWPGILIAGISLAAILWRINFLMILAVSAGLGAILYRGQERTGQAPTNIAPGRRMVGRVALAGVGLAILLTAGVAMANGSLARLDLALMKISLLAFGGGYTAIALMQQEVVERLAWGSTREFIDGIALGQITPGPIFITAVFLGYKVAGVLGGLAAAVSGFLPSFTLLVCLIPSYSRITARPVIRRMLYGILAAFMGILLSVFARFAREALVDPGTWALMGAGWMALWRKVDMLWVIGAGVLVSLLLF